MTEDPTLALDTDVNGRLDAFNPAELLLASVAACMIKGIERVSPMLKFAFRGVEVKLHGVRQDKPPKMIARRVMEHIRLMDGLVRGAR